MDGVLFMKIRIVAWVLLVFVMAGLLFAADSLWMQRSIAGKTVRLHVVANSDSPADQALKLRVRDAVLQQVSALTASCQSAEEAKAAIGTNLPLIEEAAKQVCEEEIKVSLEKEMFETRYYDTFTLPAGEYPSLRVSIGEGQGKNWWCVVFPSLCVPATSDSVEDAALTGGFTQGEAQLITGGEEEYELRFKALEWLKKLGDWLK